VLLVGPRASDAASRPDGDALLVRLPLGLRTQQLLPADLAFFHFYIKKNKILKIYIE